MEMSHGFRRVLFDFSIVHFLDVSCVGRLCD